MSDGYLIQKKDAQVIRDVVRTVKGNPRSESMPIDKPQIPSSSRDYVTVPIYNDTANALDVLNIVKVSVNGSVKEISGAMDHKQGRVAWHATEPDAALSGDYAVMQTSAAVHGIGRGLLTGVTKVRLDDADEGEYANPQEGNITHMKTAVGSGKYKVLYVNDWGNSDTWGFILLANALEESRFPAKITGETDGAFAWNEQTINAYGGLTDLTGGKSGTVEENAAREFDGNSNLWVSGSNFYVMMYEMSSKYTGGTLYYLFSRQIPQGARGSLLEWDEEYQQWKVLEPPVADGKAYIPVLNNSVGFRSISYRELKIFECPEPEAPE